MFELQVALRYLLPKKRALSTSLISLISIFVISLVVWLVVIFLSVTNGIEKRWIEKLTSIHAPIRITPTDEYYNSYYYRIDSIAQASNFSVKSLEEKRFSKISDPYHEEMDQEVPVHWPEALKDNQGNIIDLTKELFSSLDHSNAISFQDYEMAGALLRINLVRDMGSSQISQMSYVLSFPDLNPNLPKVIEPISLIELQNLLEYDPNPETVLKNIRIKRLATKENWPFPLHLLDKQKEYFAHFEKGRVYLSKNQNEGNAKLKFNGSWICTFENKTYPIQKLFLKDPLALTVFDQNKNHCIVQTQIQKDPIQFSFPTQEGILLDARAITSFKNRPKTPPPWAYFVESENKLYSDGIIVPKNYKKNGVQISDRGFFSFISPSSGSMIEQQLSVQVAGFYDPGIIPTGNKCVFASKDIARSLNASSPLMTPDGTPTNGIFVWINDPLKAKDFQKDLQLDLKNKNLNPYFTVTSFQDFEFSKTLLQQFQSDRLIFSLIAGIILIVACSNIISMLILLVNDKKKEIAMLYAMGASRKNILMIFVTCGAIIGTFSCILGFTLAVITLKNLDGLLSLLGYFQGHDLFQVAFFGDHLPNEMSLQATLFVLLLTPILSIIAGLIPAWKACNIKASKILRS